MLAPRFAFDISARGMRSVVAWILDNWEFNLSKEFDRECEGKTTVITECTKLPQRVKLGKFFKLSSSLTSFKRHDKEYCFKDPGLQ
jgi:hypothetical protein